MPLISKEIVMDWGKEAASQLINHNTPLNDTVTKIASDNSLNVDQIARVVEAANISMHTSVYKNNAYPEFDTASLPVVASRLAMPLQDKHAQYDDYDAAPNGENMLHMKVASFLDSVESEESPLTHYKKQRTKLELEKRAQEHYDELANDFYEAAEDLKQSVIQFALAPDTQYQALPLFKAAAYQFTPEDLLPALKPLMQDIEHTLKDKMAPSLFKSASSIDDIDQTMVLNPNHLLLTKLATYYDATLKVAALKDVLRKLKFWGKKTPDPGNVKNLAGENLFGWKTKAAIGATAAGALAYGSYRSGQRDAYSRMGAMQYNPQQR
jgi:hypothetical protein